jgi:glucoamylase
MAVKPALRDANTVLASIHTFDPDAGCSATTFQPCSDRALSNLVSYVDAFRGLYSINSGIPQGKAVATGRYPEDVYQGGNVRPIMSPCSIILHRV